MLKNILGFVIAFVVCLLLFEAFIQEAEIELPSTTDFDEVIGRKRRANANFTFFNEGFSLGSFNQYSYLGHAYSPKRKDSTIRIAILGDSFAESFQLFWRDQFHSIIEKELSIILGKKVEVLNFGRSGFDFADMYAYQQRFVNQFHPDLILYLLANADLVCSQTDVLIPKVILENDSLIVTNSKMPKQYLATYQKTKVLTQHSSIMQMLNSTRKLIKSGYLLPKLLDKFYPSKKQVDSHGSENIEVSDKAYAILKYLQKNTIIVNRDLKSLSNDFYKEISKNNLVFIDLNDTLMSLKKTGVDPYYWKVTNTRGHWNHEAHKAVGNFLVDKLAKIAQEEDL